jgi:hypothetical protein
MSYFFYNELIKFFYRVLVYEQMDTKLEKSHKTYKIWKFYNMFPNDTYMLRSHMEKYSLATFHSIFIN